MEVPLPWERLLWSCRAVVAPGTRYALTDFRIVRLAGKCSDELAIQDVGDVHVRTTWIDRFLGTSTIVVEARTRRQPFVFAHIRRGQQLAALLELISADSQTTWDRSAVRA